MTAARPRLAPPTVRPVEVADIAEVVALQVAAWRGAYGGIIPDDYLRAMSAAEREGRHFERMRDHARGASYLLAERDGEVVGMASAGPARDDDLDAETVGEIYALYAAPSAWSTGVGSALMDECTAQLREAGYLHVSLWVLADNTRGRRFYEHRGMHTDGGVKVLDFGTAVAEVRYAMDL